MYSNLGERKLAAENIKKAYDLKDRASELEKQRISAYYFAYVLGDREKAAQVMQMWAQTYPQDAIAANSLATTYASLGQYGRALQEYLESVRRDPKSTLHYGNLAVCYVSMNRLDEARATIEGIPGGDTNPRSRTILYLIDFLKNNPAGMAEQAAGAMGTPGIEDQMLFLEAATVAYSGHLSDARKLVQSAVASATQSKLPETAAGYEAQFALVEALLGNAGEAKSMAAQALNPPADSNVQAVAAVTLALGGSAVDAQKLADDLNRNFAEDTFVQSRYLPAVRAALALHQGNAQKAIELLRATSPYELGSETNHLALMPVYLRGQAYLTVHDGTAAVSEFQKILDHPGIVLNELIGALAHLGLARAYALAGDTNKARTAYQDFLAQWKDADPDIPILKQAKAEYAQLQQKSQ
jgi:tetratricopeptide (TPR) repeat protein